MDAAYHELLEALREPDCALCHLTTRHVGRVLESLFHELVNDPPLRLRLRAARGFCALHAPEALRCGSALGMAIIYADVTGALRESSGARRGLSAAKPPECPACAAAREADARFVLTLAKHLGDAGLQAALQEGAGLCAPHAERVLAKTRGAGADFLRNLERERLARLAAELRECVRKHDYRAAGEAWGPEQDAPRRAYEKVAGRKLW